MQIHPALAVSFYDVALAPSLVSTRAVLARWQHRVGGVSPADLAALEARLADNVATWPSGCGVDWLALVRIIKKRFGDRLALLRYLLEKQRDLVRAAHEYIPGFNNGSVNSYVADPNFLGTQTSEACAQYEKVRTRFSLSALSPAHFWHCPVRQHDGGAVP